MTKYYDTIIDGPGGGTYYPYQLCPKCNGVGQIPNRLTTTNPFTICDVCNGAKVIAPYVPETASLREQLEALKKENEWVSVEDKLPEESGRYWCYVQEINDLGKSHFQWNCCYSREGNAWTDTLERMEVTHWKPLSQPPK